MKKILLWTFLAALLGNRAVVAQDTNDDFSNIPPPKPPYVARAELKSAWTIVFTPNASATGTMTTPGQPAKKQLKQQDWTKSNALLRCVNEWTDGTSSEEWIVGPMLMARDVKDNGIHIYSATSDPRYHNFTSSDFAGLDWIVPNAYDKVVKHGGEPCYQFTAKTLTTSDADNGPHNKTLAQLNAPTTATTAFISVQSGLPVEIDNGDGKFIFHYLPTPTGELKMPDDFLSLWKASRVH